jgi:hypothetical protein
MQEYSYESNPAGVLAAAVGKGLAAGLLGTAVMTAGQMVEMKLEDREPSSMPADAVKKVFGLETRSEADEQRLAQLVHWGYGTAWGGVRGLLGGLGLGCGAATLVHLAAVWGAALVMLPALDLTEPATEWPPKQLGVDLLHHAVYAGAVGAAYAWLDR